MVKKTLKGFNTKLERIIRQLEENIRNIQGKERALYIDGYGNVLFDSDKAGCKTDACHVYVDNNDELALVSSVAIHSHPVRLWGGCYLGSSFSPNDIVIGMENNFNEIRFCDKYYTGILTRNSKYWRNDWTKYWNKTTIKKINDELNHYKKYYRNLAINGKMKLSEYLQNYEHYCMEDFARKHGLDYKRELRHNLPPIPDFTKTLSEKEQTKFPKMILK